MFTVVLLGVASVLAYVVACAVWPFANCGRCGGSGRRSSPSGRAFGNCRRCKGAGRRLRLGRRLWNLGHQ